MQQEQAPLAVGTLLRERYLLKKRPSPGQSIYLARDQQSRQQADNLCVLKEIVGLDQPTRYQFTLSGIALRRVQHPALPRIRHVLNDDRRDCVYLVADYIEGANLETLRDQQPGKRFAWSNLQTLLEPVIDALISLHRREKPLYHGDIKPTNIIIQNSTGKSVLVDLGYAQAATPELLQQVTQARPSPYHAPEYAEGKIDALSDVYGLAATLYALLTGHAPIDAQVRRQQVNRRKIDPQHQASALVPGLAHPLAEALQRALALNPSERFPSIQEFWETLKAIPTHQPDPTPPPVTPPIEEPPTNLPTDNATRATSNKKLRPRAMATIGIVLLLLFGSGMWFWTTHRQPISARSGNTSASSTSHTATSLTPTLDGYPDMLGTYSFYFIPIDPPTESIVFTLKILHQEKNKIDGTLVSNTTPEETVIGTVDRSENIAFTIIGTSGNAAYFLQGGANGSSPGANTLAGTFYNCLSGRGKTCVQDTGKNRASGQWTMSYLPGT